MVELSQVYDSVFSLIEAQPSDLATQRNTCRLISLNQKAKYQVKTLQDKQLYKPVVIVGPSGAGKGTLIDFVTKAHPEKFGFSVSYTTRPKREGEVDGVHYNFITVDKFKEMVANDEFIEHCTVHEKMYGTAKAQITSIQEAKKIPLLDIDVQGALKFVKVFPDSNFIAVLPTGEKMLRKRLEGRGTEKPEVIDTRVGNSTGEMKVLLDDKKTFTYRVINDNLEVSKRTLDFLMQGLYAEELTGKDTNQLIAETPNLTLP